MTAVPSIDDSLAVGAIVFAESNTTFTPRQFADFVRMAGRALDEETADELLSDLADAGRIRQIGPGVYASSKPAPT